jgi:hypothetical protein
LTAWRSCQPSGLFRYSLNTHRNAAPTPSTSCSAPDAWRRCHRRWRGPGSIMRRARWKAFAQWEAAQACRLTPAGTRPL